MLVRQSVDQEPHDQSNVLCVNNLDASLDYAQTSNVILKLRAVLQTARPSTPGLLPPDNAEPSPEQVVPAEQHRDDASADCEVTRSPAWL